MIKLLALDLDGTLLDDKSEITVQNSDMIKKAQQKGVKIVISTGRMFIEAYEIMESADFYITANGARMCDNSGNSLFSAQSLSDEQVQLIVNTCEKYNTDPCFFSDKTMYHGDAFFEFYRKLNTKRGRNPDSVYPHSVYVSQKDKWTKLCNISSFDKAILHHSDPNIIDLIINELASYNEFTLAPSVLFGGEMKNVEINRKGIDKGSALEKLAKALNIPMSDVMAIGDSDNDITMLEKSGLGIAMGNAEEHIKQIANAETLTNTESGVAAAIKQYILEGIE